MQITNRSQYRSQWRSYILAITSISINLAAVCTFLFPSVGNRRVAEFEFPSKFGLAREVIAEDRIEQIKNSTETIQARQQYRYGEMAIALELNYVVNTRGGVDTYLRNYTDITEAAIAAKSVKQIEGIGHHALLTDGDRAYLTGCISPRSPANVTQKQFSQYRYQNDLSLQIGWQWLRGQASIRDRRCLWVLMAIPVEEGSSQAKYRDLEAAWQDIYRWWLPNFPTLV